MHADPIVSHDRRQRRHDRRAGLRQRREARAARRSAAGARRIGARPPDRHLLAGARADRAAARKAAALLGGRPPIHVRGRPAACGCAAAGRRSDARAAARIEHRKLRHAGRRGVPRADPRAPWRPAICSCSAPISSRAKPTLLLAYDDPLGVTAAFNRNLLVRINRELGGDFDLAAFAHRAVWNPEQQRIEMHLVSVSDRSYAFRPPTRLSRSRRTSGSGPRAPTNTRPTRLSTWGPRRALPCRDQWIDDDAGFALTLFTAL